MKNKISLCLVENYNQKKTIDLNLICLLLLFNFLNLEGVIEIITKENISYFGGIAHAAERIPSKETSSLSTSSLSTSSLSTSSISRTSSSSLSVALTFAGSASSTTNTLRPAPSNTLKSILYPPAKFSTDLIVARDSAASSTQNSISKALIKNKLKAILDSYNRDKSFNSLSYLVHFISQIHNKLSHKKTSEIKTRDLLDIYPSFLEGFTQQKNDKVQGRNCVGSAEELKKIINESFGNEFRSYLVGCHITSKSRGPYYEWNPEYHHVAIVVPLSDNSYIILDPTWRFNEPIIIEKEVETNIENNRFSLDLENQQGPKIIWFDSSDDMRREYPLREILNPEESVTKPSTIASSAQMLLSYYPGGESRLEIIIDFEHDKIQFIMPFEKAADEKSKRTVVNFKSAESELSKLITDDWALQLGYSNSRELYNHIMLVVKWAPLLKEMKECFKKQRG